MSEESSDDTVAHVGRQAMRLKERKTNARTHARGKHQGDSKKTQRVKNEWHDYDRVIKKIPESRE